MNDEQVRKIVDEALAAQQKLFTQQVQQSTMFNRNIKVEQLKAKFKNHYLAIQLSFVMYSNVPP